jgi:hypothetical protein
MIHRRSLAFIILLASVAPLALRAQSEAAKPPAFGIAFSGYVRTDLLYDTRQTLNLREGHFLLYPKAASLDKDGRDTNAAPSFHMLAIQTRLAGKITGPDALGAKTSGLIEGEFFGMADSDINGFRLRQAYVSLDWSATQLLVGQTWHPMFITDCFPDVVSFNTGAPFQPFNRSPQVRLTQRIGGLALIASAVAQRDFASNGPDGASSAYARNAALPEFNLKVQYAAKLESGTEILAGAGGDVLTLKPRLATALGYKTDATVTTWAGMGYLKVRMRGLTIKAEGAYGGNMHHLTMIGGYGVQAVTDAARDEEAYGPLRTVSAWAELQTNGEKVQAGLFAGYSKNLGANRDIAGAAFARGANIDRLFRIAPRLVYNAAKLRLAAEVEYTAAAYGTPDARGIVRGASTVANLRILGAVTYLF